LLRPSAMGRSHTRRQAIQGKKVRIIASCRPIRSHPVEPEPAVACLPGQEFTRAFDRPPENRV
jgi:hypothetical protein